MGDNIKISYINSSKKYEEHYNEKFKSAQLIKVDKKGLIDEAKRELREDNKLFNEYVKFKYLYENGGMLLDGDFEFINSINSFFKNDFFIGFSDDKNIASNIIYTKKANNSTISKILDIIRGEKYDNITDVLSEIVGKDLHENYNYVLKFDENSFIYPYDYFYPIDYERVGKGYTDNIKAIYFSNTQKLNFRQSYKVNMLRKIGPTACEYFFGRMRVIKNHIGAITKSELMEMNPDISDTTIQRTLAALLKCGEIEKIGGGRYTKYVWKLED